MDKKVKEVRIEFDTNISLWTAIKLRIAGFEAIQKIITECEMQELQKIKEKENDKN